MSNTKPDPYLQGLATGRTTDEMCDLFSTPRQDWKEPPRGIRPPEAIYAGKAPSRLRSPTKK